jgi:MSHA biogenesis protein MshP
MRLQKGFGMIAAIVVLVMLATLAAAIVALSTAQNKVLVQDILSARAMQAARAGTEWGLSQAFSNAGAWGGVSCDSTSPPIPPASPSTVSATLSNINGFQVVVSCWSAPYKEGDKTPATADYNCLRVYHIYAVACPVAAASCPEVGVGASSDSYVERRREVIGEYPRACS